MVTGKAKICTKPLMSLRHCESGGLDAALKLTSGTNLEVQAIKSLTCEIRNRLSYGDKCRWGNVLIPPYFRKMSIDKLCYFEQRSMHCRYYPVISATGMITIHANQDWPGLSECFVETGPHNDPHCVSSIQRTEWLDYDTEGIMRSCSNASNCKPTSLASSIIFVLTMHLGRWLPSAISARSCKDYSWLSP